VKHAYEASLEVRFHTVRPTDAERHTHCLSFALTFACALSRTLSLVFSLVFSLPRARTRSLSLSLSRSLSLALSLSLKRRHDTIPCSDATHPIPSAGLALSVSHKSDSFTDCLSRSLAYTLSLDHSHTQLSLAHTVSLSLSLSQSIVARYGAQREG